MQKLLDRFSIGLSGLCAIHCLLTPVAITVFPILGAFMANNQMHFILYMAVVPSSAIALFIGCNKHKDKATIVFGAAGLIALSIAVSSVTEQYSLMYISLMKTIGGSAMRAIAKYERLLTVSGSIFLIAAHTRNYILCRHGSCEH